MAHPAVVLGGILIVGGAAYVLLRSRRRILVNSKSSDFPLVVALEAPATLSATLEARGTIGGWRQVGGTVTYNFKRSVFDILPSTVTPSASAAADAQLIPSIKGSATITVNGRSAEGLHDPLTIAVTVK